MLRRDFMKLMSVAAATALFPTAAEAATTYTGRQPAAWHHLRFGVALAVTKPSWMTQFMGLFYWNRV